MPDIPITVDTFVTQRVGAGHAGQSTAQHEHTLSHDDSLGGASNAVPIHLC